MQRLLMNLLALSILAVSVVGALASVPAPQSIIIVACRVDDLTGQPGRQDPKLAARDWRDLELHVENGELQCKRVRLDLEDSAVYGAHAPSDLTELRPNFGNWAQCARVGVMQAGDWNAANPGWGVVAVGCPTPIVNDKGEVVAWKLPGCPTYLPGSNGSRMKCVFDESAV